jgi:hypothetical protein
MLTKDDRKVIKGLLTLLKVRPFGIRSVLDLIMNTASENRH